VPSKDINLQTSRSEREKPINQHLTDVTNECSDTEPVMFILQEHRLYLELEILGPFVMLRSSISEVASFYYLVCCLLHCSLSLVLFFLNE
jgi:hypothetical protein